jgi:hypothetical protein
VKTDTGETELLISPEGKILEEEQIVTEADLPEPVQKALAASKYGKAKVLRVEKVISSDKPRAPSFELVVEQGGKKRELLFSFTGTLTEDEDAGDEE